MLGPTEVRIMKPHWIVSALISLVTCAPVLAQSDAYRRCMEYPRLNPDLGIQACSSAIQSGLLSDEQLAVAHFNRGQAYYAKGEYDAAIQDYHEAIRIKPLAAEPFNSRGLAYAHKGEYDRALQD